MGIEFTIRKCEIDESFPSGMPIPEIPGYLAKKKAEAFVKSIGKEIILTADTIVTYSNKILGKPKDERDAAGMLEGLSGKPHLVYTGICLRHNNQYHSKTDCTSVHFKELSKSEIDYYIQHYLPLDKAGAYGIQEWIGMIGIKKIEGSYFNVVGLPVFLVYDLLKELNLILL
jgi:septum formation protein